MKVASENKKISWVNLILSRSNCTLPQVELTCLGRVKAAHGLSFASVTANVLEYITARHGRNNLRLHNSWV